MQKRAIKPEEKDLINYLISMLPAQRKYELPNEVKSLNDGGMGTIELAQSNGHFKDLVQVKYSDTDEVMVLITLTENTKGDLHELDIWKTDFSPLNKFPKPEDVEFVI